MTREIEAEFRSRGAGAGAAAFYEGRPLLAVGVVLQETETFRLAKGIDEARFLHCSFGETFTFTDPDLAEGELTATVRANLLVFRPGG